MAGVFSKNRIDTRKPSYTLGIGYFRDPLIVDLAFLEEAKGKDNNSSSKTRMYQLSMSIAF